MFSMLRMLLRTSYPIERPSLKVRRKADTNHLPWIRIDLKQQSFLSDTGLPLCLMAMECRVQPLSCLNFFNFPVVDYET